VDVHVRLLIDKLPRYDAVGKRYAGPLWLLVIPKSFSVVVSPGLSLNQMRFFDHDTRFDELYLEMMFEAHGGLLFSTQGERVRYGDLKQSDGDGSILLSLGLDFPRPGFLAEETAEPIDLALKGHHDPRRFFREIEVRDNSLALKLGSFYILSTGEYVRVPPEFACEMRPMDERSGDLRSHYAGFIDPGWGVGGGAGRPLTLEVRSFDTALVVRHGQPIAKIRYECVTEPPEEHYDEMAPTYGSQIGPVLAKYFSEWK
jgi:dCTP deaminase